MVCKDAWCRAYGTKKDRLRRVLLDVKDGKLEHVHGNNGLKRMADRSGDCVAWLKFFVNCVGDHQPDKSKTHLPSCFTKIAIYNKMKTEFAAYGLPVVCPGQWYRLWKDHCPHVLIPKVNMTCRINYCALFKSHFFITNYSFNFSILQC